MLQTIKKIHVNILQLAQLYKKIEALETSKEEPKENIFIQSNHSGINS